MKQTNQSQEYNRLFEQYNKMSNEELTEITKPKNGYTEIAVKVASDILQSDRTEYYENIKRHQQKKEEKPKVKRDDILFSMSKDIHSIKNMMLFFVILTILGIISAFYFGYEIQSYFKSLPF